MTTILVADDEAMIRGLIEKILVQAEYEVTLASDGPGVLEKIRLEHPDLLILDVDMPAMNGFDVVRSLRSDPCTVNIPVIMMTGVEAAQGEQAALDLEIDHYITKPASPDVLKAAVRTTLRERGIKRTPLRTGAMLLDKKLGGGIPIGSLTLIEGTPASGKSVLCQHLMSGGLRDGYQVACFTSENSVKSLLSKMDWLGLGLPEDAQSETFNIYPLEPPREDADPKRLLIELIQAIELVPRHCKIICVDAITNLASASDDQAILDFFTACKRLADHGKTLILVIHSGAFDENLLTRLRSMCDAHLNLRVEEGDKRKTRVLEVSKIHRSEGMTGSLVEFSVEPGLGIRVLPLSKVQV